MSKKVSLHLTESNPRADDAGPIGLSLMVVMADRSLQHIERRSIAIALRTTPSVFPITFKRYVDDTFSR